MSTNHNDQVFSYLIIFIIYSKKDLNDLLDIIDSKFSSNQKFISMRNILRFQIDDLVSDWSVSERGSNWQRSPSSPHQFDDFNIDIQTRLV